MKHKFLLLMLLCLILSVTGCSQTNKESITQDSQKIEHTTETNETTLFTETQDFTEAVSYQKPKILSNAIPVDERGILNYIPNQFLEENLMQELVIFQDQLLSSCFVYDSDTASDILKLRLLSLDSGELLYETELATGGSYSVVVQVCEDNIVVSDAQNAILHIFDETLSLLETYDIFGDMIYVDSSISKAYCLTSSDGIHILDLETKKEEILLQNTSDLTLFSCFENNLCVRYIDLTRSDKKECYSGLNMENGNLETFEIDESFSGMEYCNGIWAGSLLSEENTYFTGTQKEPYKFHLDLNYPLLKLVGDPVQLIFSATDLDGTQSMYAYKTDGSFLSSCSTKMIKGTITSKLFWLDNANGCFFILIDETGHDQLYFWDFSKETDGQNLEMKSYYEEENLGGEILDSSFYDRAKTLSQKYNVTVKIADQCLTDFSDKNTVQECEPDTVKKGLDILEETLACYPDGFFGQLYYGAYRTMEIHLTGPITDKEEIEGHTPSAFVQHENGKILMVLNITESQDVLKQNFHHEASHIIDKVLEHDALYRKNAKYSEEAWRSLNPEEFIALNPETGGYYESYEIMPMEYFQEIFSSYFVIDYGKSFSTEDRATLFEAAMSGDTQRFSPDVCYPLYTKLNYYSQCIRDCFDTSTWPEHTVWESAMYQ